MTHHGSVVDGINIHRAHAYEYADATERLAATGFTASEVGKLARQLDNNYLYMLTDESPITWQAVATGGTPATHTHVAADITDFSEAVDDRVGTLVIDSSSIDATYNDGAGTLSLALIDEYVRDLVGTFLLPGTGITVTVDDAGNTITLAATGAVVGTHSHTHPDVTDWDEAVDDRVGTLLADSTNIDVTYNDAGNAESIDLTTVAKTSTINFVIDGGGSVITTGVKGDLVVDVAGTITAWTILADVSGSIVVDIWKDSYTNFPPIVGDAITGAEKPTLASALKNQDTSLASGSGWPISAGDILRFNVDSAATVTRATVALKFVRS